MGPVYNTATAQRLKSRVMETLMNPEQSSSREMDLVARPRRRRGVMVPLPIFDRASNTVLNVESRDSAKL